MQVFLDLDGVCCDFAGGVAKHLNKKLPTEWPLGKHLADVLGITHDEIWDVLDEAGEEFWVSLKPYPWFKTLYAALKKEADELFFLTSPSRHISSLSGKQRWLNEHVGRSFDKVIFTNHKELLADPDSCLIDDQERNITAFIAAGGKGLLFPQPWNGHETPLNPVEHVTRWMRANGGDDRWR